MDVPDTVDDPGETGPTVRRDVVCVLIAAGLVATAALVPLVLVPSLKGTIFAQAPPLFAHWLPHLGIGTAPAILIVIAVVAWLPSNAHTLGWNRLLLVGWATAAAWTVSLALVDGWQRGVAGRLERPDEYLSAVPGVRAIGPMLHDFARRIPDYQPDSWTTHVSGHPPGALLTFVWLDRIGLGGGGWAAAWVVLVGTSAVAAVLITVRRIGSEEWARRCLPFLVLFPGWVWVGVSGDGYFMGVAAWGVALLAIAATTRHTVSILTALAAGVLFGFAIFLNYGLVLIGAVALAVLIAARTARPLPVAVIGALAVVAAFRLAGFWWFDGYHAVVVRYYQGIASERPFAYWGWANLAAVAIAVGPATIAGLGRLGQRDIWRHGPALLVIGGLAAMLAADLSALSKAETERIWLPFSLWLIVATGLLPRRHVRVWLVAQAAVALAVNHLLLTYW
ncbi:hypothetical protein [Gordonia sp. CPCC 205515]|uniref:hypothetical protein n=1 Tax=Gordonia sp. CPCC 205515 TaxID=3140791 RepID=UPI003AF38FD1